MPKKGIQIIQMVFSMANHISINAHVQTDLIDRIYKGGLDFHIQYLLDSNKRCLVTKFNKKPRCALLVF